LNRFRKKALVAFISLLVLTAVTVWISRIHLGAADSHVGNIAVGLLVATLKASLVALIFMHLISEKLWIYGIFVVTLATAVSLILLPIASEKDGVTGSENVGQQVAVHQVEGSAPEH
jgi:cytochrome c oxidase subunit 4